MGVQIGPGPSGPLQVARKTLTFTGAAGLGLSGSAITFFTITGTVNVSLIVGTCTGSLVSAGGGTLALGVTGATTLFIGATTATTITTTAKTWASTTPNATGIAAPAAIKDIIIAANILGTVGTADITGGSIEIECYYLPLLAGSGLA